MSIALFALIASAAAAPAGTTSDDDVKCYEYVYSVRNTDQKLQNPDEKRYILARSDKKNMHPEWQLSNNEEECRKAILL